jgi:hypothetical protein
MTITFIPPCYYKAVWINYHNKDYPEFIYELGSTKEIAFQLLEETTKNYLIKPVWAEVKFYKYNLETDGSRILSNG